MRVPDPHAAPADALQLPVPLMSIRGETLERVEARIRAALELEDTREGHVHRLAREALRALVRDENDKPDVPTELIVLGGAEPGSVQSMFKATIGGDAPLRRQRGRTLLTPCTRTALHIARRGGTRPGGLLNPQRSRPFVSQPAAIYPSQFNSLTAAGLSPAVAVIRHSEPNPRVGARGGEGGERSNTPA